MNYFYLTFFLHILGLFQDQLAALKLSEAEEKKHFTKFKQHVRLAKNNSYNNWARKQKNDASKTDGNKN